MAGQGVYEDCKVQVEKNQDDVNNFISTNIKLLSENKEHASIVALYSENTTKTLNLFKCTDKFETQYESVYKEHESLLVKIREVEVVLLKKHKKAKIGRRVAIGVAVTVFIPVVALTVLAVSAGGADAGGKAVESSKKLAGMLKKYQNSKEAQIFLCVLIEESTKINIEAMKMIKDGVLSHS